MTSIRTFTATVFLLAPLQLDAQQVDEEDVELMKELGLHCVSAVFLAECDDNQFCHQSALYREIRRISE